MVVLPQTKVPGAMVVARKLLASVRQRELRTVTGELARVTVSMGLATLAGPWTRDWDADALVGRLYRAADEALYAAKEAGRDQICRASEPVCWE